MEQVAQGTKITTISQLFKISRDTIYQWKHRKVQTGDVKAKTGYQQGHSHKIKDWNGFKEFVSNHSGKTLLEMKEGFQSTLSTATLARAIKKIGYTHKKRHGAIRNDKRHYAKHLNKNLNVWT